MMTVYITLYYGRMNMLLMVRILEITKKCSEFKHKNGV